MNLRRLGTKAISSGLTLGRKAVTKSASGLGRIGTLAAEAALEGGVMAVGQKAFTKAEAVLNPQPPQQYNPAQSNSGGNIRRQIERHRDEGNPTAGRRMAVDWDTPSAGNRPKHRVSREVNYHGVNF